jgi:hypothetical protein
MLDAGPQMLVGVAAVLQRHPYVSILVDGHSKGKKNTPFLQKLSEKRAFPHTLSKHIFQLVYQKRPLVSARRASTGHTQEDMKARVADSRSCAEIDRRDLCQERAGQSGCASRPYPGQRLWR